MQETLTVPRAAVDGGQLEYDARGQGEPVLFIHGAHVAASYLPMMREPSLANHRLIRYHRRGYADSTPAEGPPDDYLKRAAADAAALLSYLDAEPAHVVGHSSGALIALQLALDASEVVRSLVLLEPPLNVPAAAAFGEALGPVVERYHSGDRVGAVDGFMRLVAGADWRAEVGRAVPGGVEQAERDAATFFELEMLAVNAWQLDQSKADKVTQPVLCVLGSESLPFFAEAKDLVHSWFPQSEDYLALGLNHALQLQDPETVAEAIATFLHSG